MITDLKNHEKSWGPNVWGPSVPGVQVSPQGTLGPRTFRPQDTWTPRLSMVFEVINQSFFIYFTNLCSAPQLIDIQPSYNAKCCTITRTQNHEKSEKGRKNIQECFNIAGTYDLKNQGVQVSWLSLIHI